MPIQELAKKYSKELKRVDKTLFGLAKSHVALIPEISSYIASSGGKRIRPLITLACSDMVGGINEKTIYLATAVELIHTATLLHDDVVDGSKTRRGKLTANLKWGNKESILVGDYLFSQAFKLMVKAESLWVLSLLAQASAQIAEAEVYQIELLKKPKNDLKSYIKLITGKTAVLFAAAAAAGAMVGGADEKRIKKFYEFGLNMGISFQIVDDTLDYFASSRSLGKEIGMDFAEGKITLPLILLSKHQKDIKNLTFKSALTQMKKFHVKHSCVDMAQNYADEAVKNINGAESLSGVVRSLVSRIS